MEFNNSAGIQFLCDQTDICFIEASIDNSNLKKNLGTLLISTLIMFQQFLKNSKVKLSDPELKSFIAFPISSSIKASLR